MNIHIPWDRRSGFPDLPLEPPSAMPFRSGPPRAVPKRTLELPGSPQDGPETAQALQGPLKFAKSTIKKRWKYVHLALQEHFFSFFFIFWRFLGPLGHALVSDLTIQTPLMAPKSAPEPSQRSPWEGLGPPQAPQSDFSKFASKKEPARAPKCPPRVPQGPPRSNPSIHLNRRMRCNYTQK